MDFLYFPPEILEVILSFCDGQTILTLEHLHTRWKEVIEYLEQRDNLWKTFCEQDIPKNLLSRYITKWTNKSTKEIKWKSIYKYWINWASIIINDMQYECNKLNLSTTNSCERITCITALGEYIAVASDIGTVKILNQNGDIIQECKYNSKVSSLHFMMDFKQKSLGILIAIENSIDFVNIHNSQNKFSFEKHRALSIFQNCFCMISNDGFLKIARIIPHKGDDNLNYKIEHSLELAHIRKDTIYDMQYQVSKLISESEIILLLDDNIVFLSIKTPLEYSESVIQLHTDPAIMKMNIFLTDDAVIYFKSISRTVKSCQEMHFLVHYYSRIQDQMIMVFSPQSTLGTVITCVTLYETTLILGTFSGFIYFYDIESWTQFNLSKYLALAKVASFGPIVSIHVSEYNGVPKIYCINAGEHIYRLDLKQNLNN